MKKLTPKKFWTWFFLGFLLYLFWRNPDGFGGATHGYVDRGGNVVVEGVGKVGDFLDGFTSRQP